MAIEILGEMLDTVFATFVPKAAGELEPRYEFDREAGKRTDIQRKAADGRVLYGVDMDALRVDDAGNITGKDFSRWSVSVLENNIDIVPGKHYGLSGKTTFTAYENGGRIAYSVVAERLVPVEQRKSIDVQALANQLTGKKSD